MTAGFKFEEGDKVLCHHADRMIYEAKIMKREVRPGHTEDVPGGPHYFVHYKGWKATYVSSRNLSMKIISLKTTTKLQMG